MSTEFNLGQDPAPEPPGPGSGDRDADVLFLNPALDPEPAPDGAGRGGRPPALPPPGDQPDGDATPATMTTWTVSRSWSAASCRAARWTRRTGRARSPRAATARTGRRSSRPRWRSRAAVAASLTWAAREARYHAGFHAVRAPKYAVKTAVYAVPGALRTITRLIRWASAEQGNWHLRQAAADSGDAATWLALDARRQRQARWRWPVLLTGAVVLAAGLAVLAVLPGLALWRLLAAGRRWWPPPRGPGGPRTSRSPTGCRRARRTAS